MLNAIGNIPEGSKDPRKVSKKIKSQGRGSDTWWRFMYISVLLRIV